VRWFCTSTSHDCVFLKYSVDFAWHNFRVFLWVLRKCFFQGETLGHEMQFCISHIWFNKWLVIFLSLMLDVIGEGIS
jgi:hypothetical protein